jgi:hypothetical protein
LEHKAEAVSVIRALIEKQRRPAMSPDPAERFRTLWIAARLKKLLAQCTDREIGKLLIVVQDRFHIFEPEFAICYYAQRRLLLRSTKENLNR